MVEPRGCRGTTGRSLTQDLGRALAFTLLGVASPGCDKSVEIIGFGPLEAQPPTAASTVPPPGVNAPGSALDAAGVGTDDSARDASVSVSALDASSTEAASTEESVSTDALAPTEVADAAPMPPKQDAAMPDALGPFGTPVPLDEFAGADDPSFTADGLEIYFDANDSSRIHVAVRASRSEPWGPAIAVDAVGAGANGTTPWITPDGLQLYFAAEREGGAGVMDLWRIERPERGSPWGEAQALPTVNTALEEFSPSLSTDGLQLLFTRAEVGLGVQELWLARRDSIDLPWNEPQALDINDPSKKDSDPVFSPDALEVWWVHGVSDADHDLYFARRATLDEPFAMPTPATELNSTAMEGDPWMSADGRELVFFSTRTGERLLYRATR